MNRLLVHQLRESLRHEGLIKTLGRSARYLQSLLRYRRFARSVLTLTTVEERFTSIYRTNHWGSGESASGPGSTLAGTASLRSQLPDLVRRFSIKSFLDAPCGDFHWMRQLLPALEVAYTGADIVKSLVESLESEFGRPGVRFIHLDLTTHKIPPSDLLFCRDCLFHLSYRDTLAVLTNFVDSGSRYLMTTTYASNGLFANRDITTGDFRFIDLFAPPYSLPRDVLAQVPDWEPPLPERYMCLWSREQISASLASFSSELASDVA